MKYLLIALLCFTLNAQAEETCYKIGQKIQIYAAVDMLHSFHDGNGFHITSPLLTTRENFCVVEANGEKVTFENGDYSFQISPDSHEKYKLKDGELVLVEGIVNYPGDTAWYSGHPLFEITSIKKKYKKDPAVEEFEKNVGR